MAIRAGSTGVLGAAVTRAAADGRTDADNVGRTVLANAKTCSDTRLQPVVDKLIHVRRSGNNVHSTGANLPLRNGLGAPPVAAPTAWAT